MPNLFSLKNKKAVITGGGSGIGKSISLLFAQQGASVIILDTNSENAEETVSQIKNEGGLAIAHLCNVANQSEVIKIFEEIGNFNILINNAGIAHIGKATTTSEPDFDHILNINVKGVYNCLHAAIPHLIKSGGGVIINMASIAAWVGLADRFAYSAAKGAVAAMTVSVAKDYIGEGIRCNSISPARVHTPFVDGFIKNTYPGREAEIFETLSKTQPIGRMGKP